METFMSILFVLSIVLIVVASGFLVVGAAVVYDEKRCIESGDLWLLLICIVVGLGGYVATIYIDDYQAEMKVDKFKATCVLEGSEGRFDAIKKSIVVKIDGDVEVELAGADWTLRIGDEMLNATSLPKCAGVSK